MRYWLVWQGPTGAHGFCDFDTKVEALTHVKALREKYPGSTVSYTLIKGKEIDTRSVDPKSRSMHWREGRKRKPRGQV